MTLIYPVASGKGGVGKTVLTANLGIALAKRRKTVVVVDMDLGGSNLHTCLGIKNTRPGLGSFAFHKETTIPSLLVETGIDRLFLIPGDGLLPGTANIPFFVKNRIMQGIAALEADFVIIDLGAGTSNNVVDFFIPSPSGIIVASPEVTSILNAYSFLKTAVTRLLFHSFPAKSPERAAVTEFISRKIEGTSISFADLIGRLKESSPACAVAAEERLASMCPKIVLNLVRDRGDLAIGARLRGITRKHLNVRLEYLGLLPWDEAVPQSVRDRKPILASSSHANAYARGIEHVTEKLLKLKEQQQSALYGEDEDLEMLSAEWR